MDSGVHVSLHVSCHHQIIHAKFNLQIYCPKKELCGIVSMQARIISEKQYSPSIGNKFINDFKEKSWTFQLFFSKQRAIIDNGSKLPSNLVYHTNKKLCDIVFNSEYIGKVISGLVPNKAHGHDMISIRMLKMCGESIQKPLEYIFRASLND